MNRSTTALNAERQGLLESLKMLKSGKQTREVRQEIKEIEFELTLVEDQIKKENEK